MDALEVRAGGRDRVDGDERFFEPGAGGAIEHRVEPFGAFGMARARQMVQIRSVGGEQHGHGGDANPSPPPITPPHPVDPHASRARSAGATVAMMTNEADRRPPPVELRAHGISCRVRSFPSHPGTASLVLYQQRRLPTVAELGGWLEELAAAGFARVRTSALAATASTRVEAAGFATIQELVLLEHPSPAAAPAPQRTTSRLLADQHRAASAVDRAAFGPAWALDPEAIDDVRTATPRHRARILRAGPDARDLAAYAITGRDGRLGFLQRLAVDPAHQRQGLGRALVLDSLRWSARWRVQRVLVNTPTDNEPALTLYRDTGFHRLPDRLRVYERALT